MHTGVERHAHVQTQRKTERETEACTCTDIAEKRHKLLGYDLMKKDMDL